MELCRIVAKLSIFTGEKRPHRIRRYDHDNLGPIFYDLSYHIIRILDEIQFRDYLRKDFVWEGDIMRAELTPAWFDDRVEWFIGVDHRGEISDDECRRWLSPDNDFLWKFGGMRDLLDPAAIGLSIRVQQRGLATLPPHQYWSYWQVDKDSPIFLEIERSHIIAAYIRDRKVVSSGPNRYVGTSRFAVMNEHGKTVELQLALFGVRR